MRTGVACVLMLLLFGWIPAWGQNEEVHEVRIELTDQKSDRTVTYKLRFEFPIRGGPLRGEGRIEERFLDSKGVPVLQVYTGTITGRYLPGYRFPDDPLYRRPEEGGRFFLKMHGQEVTPPCSFYPDGRTAEQWREFSGVLEASGNGFLGQSERLPFKFHPFGGACGCKLNLTVYGAAVREKLMDRLLARTSQELYTRFVAGSEQIASSLLRKAQTARALKRLGSYKLPGLTGPIPKRPPPDFLDKLQKGFENSRLRKPSPACAMLSKLASNLDLSLKLLETAEAASAGDYASAAGAAAVAAVGEYSNLAGITLALAAAAKADWDAYAQRVHEKFFRIWYVKLYYQGGRPSDARWKAGEKARLHAFMEDAIFYLQATGWEATQFRRVLKDFAYYNLPSDAWGYFGLGSRALTDKDLEVTDGEPGKLKSRYGGVVLAALFRAYEETFRKDYDAELFRQLAVEQMKAQRKLVVQTDVALEAATQGNFSKAWPHGEQCWRLRGIFEETVADFKQRGLLKP